MRVKGKAEICSICAVFREGASIANVIIFSMKLALHRRFLVAALGASVAFSSCAFALQRPLSEVENLKQQAHSALASGQWDAAIQDYEKAIALAPKDANLRVELGVVLTKAGRLADSIAAFQEALRLAPHNLAAELGLAQAYRAVHNYEEARRILNFAIREHPKSAEPLAALGDFELQQQTYDAAIGHLKASLALAPANVETRNLLAGAYRAKGDLANALAERMEVEVARGQTLYRMVFERGKPKGKLEKVGRAPNRRGTKVRFRPDPDIFGAKAHFRPERIFKMARSKAYLFGGVEIRWSCAQELLHGVTDVPAEATFHFADGLKEYLSAAINSDALIHPDIFAGSAGKVVQVGPFRFVEAQGPAQRIKDAVGDAGEVSSLQTGVVVGADAREHGHFFAPQAGNSSPPVGGHARLLGCDPGPSGGQELANLGPAVHTARLRRPSECRGGLPLHGYAGPVTIAAPPVVWVQTQQIPTTHEGGIRSD